MARSSTYRVPLRRRREGKTDFQARKGFILSGKARLVPRSSVKNVSVQIVVSKREGDVVLASAHSRELGKFGWKAATGNVPAAYLTGLLCGLRAKTVEVEDAVLDIGLVAPTRGAKVFAVLSGVLDAGVVVPHDEEKIVKERSEGKHIAGYAKSLAGNGEAYSAKFSKYLEQKVAPEKLPEHVAKVKADIIESFKKKGEKRA